MNEYAKTVDDFSFIQIGANDGKMADPLYNWIKKYGWKGILVEPQKKGFEKLKINYRNNKKNLIFENVAISDKNGTRDLFKVKDGQIKESWQKGIATFCPDRNALKGFGKNNITKETVQCITFDTLISRNKVNRIDLLQIDVEGYEYFVLKGCSRYLNRTKQLPILIVEISPVAYPLINVSLREFSGFLV